MNGTHSSDDEKIEELLNGRDLIDDFYYEPESNKFFSTRRCMTVLTEAVDKMILPEDCEMFEDTKGTTKRVAPSKTISNPLRGRHIHGRTWEPGMPQFIEGYIYRNGYPFVEPTSRTLNEYRPPEFKVKGDPKKAKPFLDHVKALFEKKTADWLLCMFAHMIQKPQQKCNTVVALYGEQGNGKDTLLQMVRESIGQHNGVVITPDMFMSQFNEYRRSVMMLISEAKPDHGMKKTEFYQRVKALAAPPEFIQVNTKYSPLLTCRNVTRTFITLNDLTALHIDHGDRRMLVAETAQPRGWKPDSYFVDLLEWASREGGAHINAWGMKHDISKWEMNQPPATEAKQRVLSQYEEVFDVLNWALEQLGFPDVIWSQQLMQTAEDGMKGINNENGPAKLREICNSNVALERRLRESYGYVRATGIYNEDGRLEIYANNKKVLKTRAIYVKRGLEYDRDLIVDRIKNFYRKEPQ